MANKNLSEAKRNKNDEFYTRLEDIEREVCQYRPYFKGKTVYCNCDDPIESNFFKFFSLQFEILGLKKLITTCYNAEGHGKKYVYTGDKNGNYMPDLDEVDIEELEGDGDFRSPECIEFLKEADIVVTNPPFSLFREYVAQLVKYDKLFLIIGNKNAITYKEIFPLIKDNMLWIGYTGIHDMSFTVPDDYEAKTTRSWRDENGTNWRSLGNACWFTNMKHNRRNLPLYLYETYSPDKFPKYDNYDAIEVSKVCEIPYDYEGVMGVPVTFVARCNPEQFSIEDARGVALTEKTRNKSTMLIKDKDGTIGGKNPVYARILIKNKHPNELVWD